MASRPPRLSMASQMPTCFNADMISSSLEAPMMSALYRMVPRNVNGSCGTVISASRIADGEILSILIPSMVIEPWDGFIRRSKESMRELLPLE